LYCILLAENGGEMSGGACLKSAPKTTCRWRALTRDQLLAAITEACAKRRAVAQAPRPWNRLTLKIRHRLPGYAIVKQLSTSNFSQVFLARNERLRRNVVLKVMNRGESQRELDDAERFQREYEIISSIAHRAIAEIYDFGSLPRHLYLAMEYSVRRLARPSAQSLSVDESLTTSVPSAEALRVIHVFGILHRDLKPANVMLREDNSPVLIDFGLARRSMDDAGTTGVGQVLGSPYYISPEQAQGQRVDTRTDLYSLGSCSTKC